ncbi:hypothetical protein [Pseudoalteromonas sp. KAN5]|uniref:restriction endonuclease n=1 Tax=Pseudoalteromonas sp. KAN5 TaxID=2916633 RepID=UPI001FCB8F55|nr:hypothetical protein [Pseudoalteromonas sp. KAN5]BDF93819.1 hypothetical protein KAN5_06570 [Pseudoalteromonas sp. KAN5]
MSIPEYLYTIPNGIEPPVQSQLQELPFNSLTWENFERLILRFVEQVKSVEHCHLYGKAGQKQEGIDLFARVHSEVEYSVYQCKRYKTYTVANLKAAISTFIAGEWINKTNHFYICTSSDLSEKKISDEIEIQRAKLKELGIELHILDKIKLSNEFKKMPKVVYDFFGKEWTRLFCGEYFLESLKSRLEPHQISEYRAKLGRFYCTLFESHENSLRNLSGENTTPKFVERYIPPNINLNFTFESFEDSYSAKSNLSSSPYDFIDDIDTDSESLNENSLMSTDNVTSIQNVMPALDWLGTESNSLVVGGPGSGKSALLKYIVLGLLEQVEIKNHNFIKSKNLLIPVWLPFGYWSNYLVNNPDSSLTGCLESWFSSMDRDDLWPLIKTAISDNRLFLVVDGIDEWKSEQSALICINKLSVFLTEKNASSIISSRPSGVEKLSPEGLNWSAAYLEGLSDKQQEELLNNCIRYRLTHQLGIKDPSFEFELKKQSHELSSEIFASRDLSELATIPLLLYMLIHLKSKSISLPHSRFSVYRELINDLIKVQPKRRKTAAQVLDDVNTFNESELISIFSYLAFMMHVKFPHGSIELSAAQKLISEFLSDENKEFGFSKRDAKKYAESFINIGESEIGLLIKKSPSEIGYFHRALQEFLTANYLFTQSFTEREANLKKYIFDNQWREVFLGFVMLLDRPSETEELVSFIDGLDCEPYEIMRKETLLAEIAFGDNKCPAVVARKIANNQYETIQSCEYDQHKSALINILMTGFTSNKLNTDIAAKLREWTPGTISWYRSLFESVDANWAEDEITLNLLLKAITLKEIKDKRMVGRVLFNKFKNKTEVKVDLVRKAKSTICYNTRMVLFEVIIRGWPASSESKSIFNYLKLIDSPEAKLLCIFYEAKNNRTSEKDREILLELGGISRYNFSWSSLVNECIESFYLNDDIKQMCINRVFNYNGDLDFDFSIHVLMTYYYTDQQVLEIIVEDLKNDHPKALMGVYRRDIRNIAKIIEHSPKMCEAVEEYVLKKPSVNYQYYQLFKTERMKVHLIQETLKLDNFYFWPLQALIQNWGAEDKEVKELIGELFQKNGVDLSIMAHLYPDIFSNKKVCFDKLLELLSAESEGSSRKRYDFIVRGILKVADETQIQIATAIFQKILEKKSGSMFINPDLILLFGSSKITPNLKKVALEQLQKRDGNIGLVASIFKNDPDVRNKVVEKLDILPATFRNEITKRLVQINTNIDALDILAGFSEETDSNIRITSTIGCLTSPLMNTSEEANAKSITDLLEAFLATGLDHEIATKNAFCGLIALKQLDKLKNYLEEKQKEKHLGFLLYRSFKPIEPFWAYLASHWDYVNRTFPFEDNIVGSENEGQFFTNIGPHLTGDSSLKEKFIKYLNSPDIDPNDRILIAASKMIPRDHLLFKLCLKALGIRFDDSGKVTSQYNWNSLLALYILEQQFRDSEAAINFLESISKYNTTHLDYILIAAYSIGFRNLPFLQKIKVKTKSQKIWMPTFFQEISSTKGNENKIEKINLCISHLPIAPTQYSKYFCKVFSEEINNTESLYKSLLKNIKNEKNTVKKVQFLILLIGVKGLSKTLKDLANDLYKEQMRKRYCDSFFDVTTGEYKTTLAALTNALYKD